MDEDDGLGLMNNIMLACCVLAMVALFACMIIKKPRLTVCDNYTVSQYEAGDVPVKCDRDRGGDSD